jgi:hypothetical protein
MNISEIKRSLKILLKHRIVPFLHGSQGEGKTSSVDQYCLENDLQLVTLMTATQDVGDLIGLLVKDDKGGVYHAKPKWFPTSGKGIIFLDELNRAPMDVLQAMFQFILKGHLHTHVLPEGWRIVAAGNYNSEKFTTTDTSDAAWGSRFCHIDFKPTIEEFLVYAESKGLNKMASFIRAQPEMLRGSAKDVGSLDMSTIQPNPRSNEFVGLLSEDEDMPKELEYEIYSGLIGVTAAAAFISYNAKAEKSISIGQILTKYKGSLRDRVKKASSSTESMRMDLLNQPIDELIAKLEQNPKLLTSSGALDNLKLYLIDIPKELSMKAFVSFGKVKSFHGKNELLNDKEYIKKFA